MAFRQWCEDLRHKGRFLRRTLSGRLRAKVTRTVNAATSLFFGNATVGDGADRCRAHRVLVGRALARPTAVDNTGERVHEPALAVLLDLSQ
jgi:hypothetical protein